MERLAHDGRRTRVDHGSFRSALAVIRRGTPLLVILLLQTVGAHASVAQASVVEHGYLPLSDNTLLNYTLTLPSAQGRFPVLLQYDPYYAGATSDPTWNASGYAMLGVNFRGTGCSQGTFQPLRADIWGADGAQVVAWAARQGWSDGNIGMIGGSFTGTSQLATAAFAGPALKAITPDHVFPDFYRDLVYPGGIHNGWIPGWILVRNYFLGYPAALQTTSDPGCANGLGQQVVPNETQSLDTQRHPYIDEYWSKQPASLLSRVHIPVLGCVTWQDTTVYSHAFNAFRELNPATTWLVGGDGLHGDCPTSRARRARFFDRYLKQQHNSWEATPHMLLVHEVAGKSPVYEKLDDHAGAWQSAFAHWSSMDAAIHPLALHLQQGGRLELTPPGRPQPADSYSYPMPTSNTPADFAGQSSWNRPTGPGGAVVYTTPVLAQDAEFLGSGSADLWIASSASDTDVQITLSEVRPDGQELYVENGWLRLSDRRLDPGRSTALRPYHTYLQADARPLVPGQPVLARVEMEPFDHVFRAGSAIRLTIDAPGGYFQIVPDPATNTVYHQPGMDSQLVFGFLPGATAHAPLPRCDSLLNQPCRPNAKPVPGGRLTIPANALTASSTSSGGGSVTCARSARLMYHLHAGRGGGRVVAARIYVDDKLVRSLRGRNLTFVTIKRPHRSSFTVKIVTTLSSGGHVTSSRRYRLCGRTRVRHTSQHRGRMTS
jgi:predicted acyl esterase